MAPTSDSDWQTLIRHGLADLSPPEVENTLLELPANRAEYVGMLQDIADWPARSAVARRVPTEDDVTAMTRLAGRWRAVTLLDDDHAIRTAASLFSRVFALDPLYDTGDLLYAAWHDPSIREAHARQLAHHASLLVRAGALLRDATLVLAPDHLPGSWDPRPGWRRPQPRDDPRGWPLRNALVLLYWADRLDAVACTTNPTVAGLLRLALGTPFSSKRLRLPQPPPPDTLQRIRREYQSVLQPRWLNARRLTRRRTRRCLEELQCALEPAAHYFSSASKPASRRWELVLGGRGLPDPALFLRRVLAGEDPTRQPPLPITRLRRRPLCLISG